jgi:hypothetical protein
VDQLILILIVPDEGYSRNLSCTLNLISTFLLLFKNIAERLSTVNNNPINFYFYSCCYVFLPCIKGLYSFEGSKMLKSINYVSDILKISKSKGGNQKL